MPALKVTDLSKTFALGKPPFGKAPDGVRAVRPMSFAVEQGETLGIVGESGCGKSTLARMLVGLTEPTTGQIQIAGKALDTTDPAAFGRLIQYVFQDPISSLNPRKTIRQIMETPLKRLYGMDRAARTARIAEIFDSVNLRAEFLDRYPHEFSGGQAQRIGIARALAAAPEIIVLDEPVSALDVSVQAQVLNLLADLRGELGLTYLFISHDLAVVEAVSDRVIVLYFGAVVEIGRATRIFNAPQTPLYQASGRQRAGGWSTAGSTRTERQRTARPAEPAAGLRLCGPLPARHGDLPGQGPTTDPDGGGPTCRLPPPDPRLTG